MLKTLYDKLWESHVVCIEDDIALLYIDRHLLHEVTSPQAFDGLRLAQRKPWRNTTNLMVADHNVPTTNRANGIHDKVSYLQIKALEHNAKRYGLLYFNMEDKRQGIVHVVGPEQGAILPGMTVVCGDSHTSTHGAFACLAYGIGTSEVEHVLATQTLLAHKSKSMRVIIDGVLPFGVFAKDIILTLIGLIGTAGATGYAIEFSGTTIHTLSMEARMTVCNMAIEAGAKAGMIAVDDTTINYLKGRPFVPTEKYWKQAVNYWRTLYSDCGVKFDKTVVLNASDIKPQVTWGTSPEMVQAVSGKVPDPSQEKDFVKRDSIKTALTYMALKPNTPIQDIYLDKIFIGSCTNSRIEDLRIAASIVYGKFRASNIKLALVVPGSGLVKEQAEHEGLDKIFKQAGFEWRESGCSMCLAMNADRLKFGERCASTSNRNFEGRQGTGGRTHLVSPAMAAAAAIAGHFVDISK